MVDEELAHLFQHSGDRYVLGLLLERHTTLLFGVALKYLKNTVAAEDAVQQVFMKCITHFPTEPIHNFKGWLFILMKNYCLQKLRKKEQYSVDFSQLSLAAPPPTDFRTLLKKEEEYHRLSDCLNSLKPDQKTSIVAFYLENKSYQQIMEENGFNFMEVKSHIQNGKRNLKNLMLQKRAQEHEKK